VYPLDVVLVSPISVMKMYLAPASSSSRLLSHRADLERGSVELV
jgi:hypothetical protein